MDTPETYVSKIEGLRLLTLEDCELRELRERRNLLIQSIADERQNLNAISRRKDWTQRFSVISTLLLQHQQEAQNASRAWATCSSDLAQLQLHDSLLTLRPTYDRIKTLQDMLAAVREQNNKEEQTKLTIQAERDAALAAHNVAVQRCNDAKEALKLRVGDISTGYHIEGTIQSLERQLRQSEQTLRQLQLSLNDKNQSLQETRQKEAAAIKEKEESNTKLQGLSAHSVMLGLYDLIKDKLAAMAKERGINEKLHAQQNTARHEREMLQFSIRQRENELTMLENERNQFKSQLLLLNQSADTALDIVRAPIIRDNTETQRQLDNFLDLRNKIRQTEEQIQITELQLSSKRTHLDELHTESAVSQSLLLSIENDMRESDTELGSLYADLDKVITLSGWFTEWQQNPDALRSRISDLYHKWRNARTSFSENSRNVELLHQSLKTAEQSVAEIQQLELQQRNQRDALRRELEDQKERLRAVFGEQTPGELEKQLNTELLNATANLESTIDALHSTQKEYNLCSGRIEALLSLQHNLQDKIQHLSSEFDLWLENNNQIGHTILQRAIVEEVFTSTTNWPTLRQHIGSAQLQDSIARTRLEDTQRELNMLQRAAGADQPGPEDSAEQLLMQQHDSSKRLEKFETELAHINAVLGAHEQANSKIEFLQRNR